jgi:hypothetical protein
MADTPLRDLDDRAADDRERRIAAAEALIAMRVPVDEVDDMEADATRFDA